MILILVLVLTLGWSSTLLAQTPFYQGKTITIAVGTKAGDVYDLYPRLLAEYMTKHIPGNPNIIVQNMPGRGLVDRRQSGLQCRQAGRLDDRRRSIRRSISIS